MSSKIGIVMITPVFTNTDFLQYGNKLAVTEPSMMVTQYSVLWILRRSFVLCKNQLNASYLMKHVNTLR